MAYNRVTVGRLADELAQYWTRDGKRMVFSNGMSLNQMAFEIWEQPGGESVDASSLSRIMAGLRLFTWKQLLAFEKILEINPRKREELKMALADDIRRRAGIT